MKLTREENREALKRYAHVKPARWGRRRCSTWLSGSSRSCTLGTGHSGPHVAHGTFNRILAVWDQGGASNVPEPVRPGPSPTVRPPFRWSGPVEALRAFGGRVLRRPAHFIEEAVFLVFFAAMIGFVIDWALRIMGWK